MKTKLDGITNWSHDDMIESKLKALCERYGIDLIVLLRNPQLFIRIPVLKKMLAHSFLMSKVVNLPGDVVELGVFAGTSLMTWAKLLEVWNVNDRQKTVWGFDNWSGFNKLQKKDGKFDKRVGKQRGGWSAEKAEQILKELIDLFDQDRFVPYKPRIRLIKGNICRTIPRWKKDHPGVRISLLHFDADMYEPTMSGLRHLWPLVVKGGIILFDEYGIPPWEGESKAVDEFFAGKIEIKRFNWCSNPGGYIIK